MSADEEQAKAQLERDIELEIERELAAAQTAQHDEKPAEDAVEHNVSVAETANVASTEATSESADAHPPAASHNDAEAPAAAAGHQDPFAEIDTLNGHQDNTAVEADALVNEEEAIAREVERRMQEEREQEEAEAQAAREREALRRVTEAEAAAKVAAQQKARIEAAVAERLRKAKEEAEEKRRIRAADEEIERRVAEALAKDEEEERTVRQRKEEAAKEAAMEAEIEKRVAAAAEARIQAALSAAGVNHSHGVTTATSVSTDGAGAVASSEAVTDGQSAATSDDASSSDNETDDDDDSGSNPPLEEEARVSDTFDPALVPNDNGMFAETEAVPAAVEGAQTPSGQLSGSPSEVFTVEGEQPWTLTASPDLLHFEGAMVGELRSRGLAVKDGRRERLVVQRFATQREVGRCLAPLDPQPKVLNHTSIQLGFFQSNQTVVSYAPNTKSAVANRERPVQPAPSSAKPKKSLSHASFFFESDLLRDPTLTADEEDEEDCPHNAPDACLVTAEAVKEDPYEATTVGTRAFSYGDPIQVYERARGRRFEHVRSPPVPPGTPAPPPGVMTVISGPTSGKLWVQDIETKKPTPAAPMFTGGTLLRINVDTIKSQVDALHGDGTDPLFFSAALYTIHTSQTFCITDTFYFDSHGFTFLPHRQPSNQANNAATKNSFVAFVPHEFKSVPVFLCVRAFRLASEEQDNYVDLYSRPDKYKQHHVVPMKQETQQLAMFSEVQEELGWVMFPVNEGGKFVQGPIKADKLFRGTKPVNDQDMMKLVMDHRSRNSLRTIQLDLGFTLSDVSNNEISFPNRSNAQHQDPTESESLLELLDPDVPNAKRERVHFTPCCLPILNAGHFHGYHNILCLRMQTVRFINLTSTKYPTSTHTSFVVQVCLKDRDADLSEEGLPVMYRKWLGEERLQTSAFTSTAHGAKEFDLGDEFKIQLPLTLTKSHHLFLTVYAVTFKKPTPTTKDPRMVKIGYAAIPILTEDTGSLYLKDTVDVMVVSAEHAAVATSGYLEKFPAMVKSNLFNMGTFALRVGLFGRTSVYASNTIVSQFFQALPESLTSALRDDKVLVNSGLLQTMTSDPQLDAGHMACLTKVSELPLPEVMAFYPMLTGYCLSIIASPSAGVTSTVRLEAMRTLTDFTKKVHDYDVSTKSLVNRRAGRGAGGVSGSAVPPSQTGCVRTTTVNLLYHYITNDLLYQSRDGKGSFRVYAGVAETLAILLETTPAEAGQSPGGTGRSTLFMRLSDLSWFYLDLILRSLYLYTHDFHVRVNTATSRSFSTPNHKRDDTGVIDFTGLFETFGRLVKQILEKLVPLGGLAVVQRLAIFIRNLSQVCDRGHVLGLMYSTLSVLEAQNTPHNLQIAVRVFVDDDDVFSLLFPCRKTDASCFLTAILIKFIGPHLVHASREIRLGGATLLYNLVCRVVNNKRVASQDLTLWAKQWVTLLHYLSENWPLYRQLNEAKAPGSPSAGAVVADKRPLLAFLMWIVYTCPSAQLREWYTSVDAKIVAGFIFIVTDAQGAFRFNHGKDKHLPEQPSLPTDIIEHISAWDARWATFVTMIGCKVTSSLLVDIPQTLATVKQEKALPAVFPFFLLLESLLSFANSTAALQVSASVLHHVVMALMPEIISRKGRMSSGVVLLTIRMMSATPIHVRSIATGTFGEISRVYYALTGSLNKLKHHTANALVAVAESKVRDLRLAGKFVERSMMSLVTAAKDDAVAPSYPSDVVARYVDDAGDQSGDAAIKYNYNVVPQFLSCDCRIAFPSYLTEGKSGGRGAAAAHDRPPFAEDFGKMSRVMLSLFRDVLRLQTDDTMKYKESKGLAYYEIVHNFLRQNTLKEVFKWLGRLHEAHKANGDYCEAGMVLVFTAALGFRITESFYAIKGAACKGARIPCNAMSYVLWHDYVRVLPELSTHLPLDNIYAMASDLSVVPDEPPFILEGQIKLMKEASEFLDKNGYYELSLKAVSVVDKFLVAKGDYKGSSVVHTAMSTWANAIATQSSKRTSYRYFLLWARMEREVGPAEIGLLKKLHKKRHDSDSDDDADGKKGSRHTTMSDTLSAPVKMIYKQPANATLASFAEAAKKYLLVLLPNESLIQLTDEMVATQPPLDLKGVDTSTSASGKLSKGVRALLKTPNKCLLTVAEVSPVFEAIHPNTKHLDRPHIVSRFEHVNRVGPSLVTKAGQSPMTRSQHVSTNLPKTQLDVMRQQLSVNVHLTERSFPSTTTAIQVASSEEQLLNPFETAVETMGAELDALESTQPLALAPLLHCLTPMGVVPPGTYYKEVVSAMHGNAKVMATVREVLRVCRDRLTACEGNGEVMQKNPETYALILKGLADVECALIDYPDAVVDTQAQDGADASSAE